MSQCLYRFFNAAGELLYVGITANPGRRFGEHSADKLWWDTVANVTIETFSNGLELRRAEKRAIENERPKHNVIHNRRNKRPRPYQSQSKHLAKSSGPSNAYEDLVWQRWLLVTGEAGTEQEIDQWMDDAIWSQFLNRVGSIKPPPEQLSLKYSESA